MAQMAAGKICVYTTNVCPSYFVKSFGGKWLDDAFIPESILSRHPGFTLFTNAVPGKENIQASMKIQRNVVNV